ncbi:hybrid sensor histidine kinase/response regulator transcription factor [Filimonas lacunae]|uniref:hybrid sensor histidine kinase/response regulator transcription factor n=1 Tax=Filimonas lacunae TaxID=477680 RepID=UPI0007D71E32|nr:hybrid sensor histidine kinase/response regulator transcription factor [Filimonas lacunae]BAV04861.1 two-component hybrid sensor and regulator [Filimonas lacunae]
MLLLQCLVIRVLGAPVITRHLTIEQGLSNNSVRCIYQDHHGFIWLGTYNGLNRYDGYHFSIFRNKIDDSTSLPHNYINAIGEDHRGNLFVGTGQGLCIYNPLQSQFTPALYIPFSNRPSERIPFNVAAIQADARGTVYIGTTGGGLMIKKENADAAIQLPCTKDAQGVCRTEVQAMTIDNQQQVWYYVKDAGLFVFNPVTQTQTMVHSQPLAVRCMEMDNTGRLWIGTHNGLFQYQTSTHTLVTVATQQAGKLTAPSVYSLALDQEHHLWIGTEGGGIDILNVATGVFEYLLPGDGRHDLSSETVYDIYQDNENRKWIGTHKGGINIIDPQKKIFQTVAHDPLHANSLASNFISSFYNDKNNHLWIGSDGGGISVWNRQTNQFTNYRHQPGNPASLSNNSVPSITEDHTGNIWIATFGGGINRFNKNTQTFEHYRCINSQTGEENNYVWKIYEDREHQLWASTYNQGRLYAWNRQANRFEMFSPDFADLFCLLEDRNGTLWGGTYGLRKLDKQHKNFQHYDISKPVRALFEDAQGRLWLGTEGMGLLLFDREKEQVVESYNESNGLCNNSVLNILGDDQGNLWLSTFNGLARFDPVHKKFSNFFQEDGLQSNQFEYNAALHLPTDEMVFGGIGGFTLFKPDSFVIKTNMPPVLLTGIFVNNQPITENSSYVAHTAGTFIRKLVVPYHKAVFSFHFAALEYTAPGKINYAYYLEGWDKSWNYTNNIRNAYYTNVNAGSYTLHIKATNAAGVWNPQEIQLQLEVLPPWYRSWWAYFVYAGLALFLLYRYNRYRVRKANLEYAVKLASLRSEKEKELAQLEIQKEKELNEKKLTFFTDVSHEFRTPLTLIINPLKDYLHNNTQNKEDLHVVYHNARRLLSLVDQLLLFRKAEAHSDQLRLVQLNFSRLCREVYASFGKAAQLKQLHYQFSCSDENLELYADRQKMEVILYNLLSNALKFTPEGGEITMSIRAKENHIEVKLADNGMGIPPDIGNKLFDRFYRVQENSTYTKSGFGIGLYLVKHFVEKHGGEITYESKPGTGTTFCLLFKKGKQHFNGLKIYDDAEPMSQLPDTTIPSTVAAVETGKTGLEELVSDQKVIVIVEDNTEIREYISSIFTSDFTVYQAAGGNEGIALAQKYLPDIIISDIMMENGNGIELCHTIKNDPALGHIPVILLTAVSDNDIILKGTESGADDYIAKPFDKELLVAKVHTLLKNRNKLQQYFLDEVTLKKSDYKISPEYKTFLDNCIAIIEQHLDDDDFSIKKLSQEMGMSHSVLYRKVKSISGQSIAGFIRFIRLRKAAEQMITSHLTVYEIAALVGMKDVKYFRKQFSALFGMPPSEYIKKYKPAFTPTSNVQHRKQNPEE